MFMQTPSILVWWKFLLAISARQFLDPWGRRCMWCASSLYSTEKITPDNYSPALEVDCVAFLTSDDLLPSSLTIFLVIDSLVLHKAFIHDRRDYPAIVTRGTLMPKPFNFELYCLFVHHSKFLFQKGRCDVNLNLLSIFIFNLT